MQKVFATSLIALFLVPSQSNAAHELSIEDIQSIQKDFFQDTTGDDNATYSKEAKPVICFNDRELLISRLTDLGKEPKIVGPTKDGHLMVIYIDMETGAFTVVEFLGSSKIGCIISDGDDLKVHKSLMVWGDKGISL